MPSSIPVSLRAALFAQWFFLACAPESRTYSNNALEGGSGGKTSSSKSSSSHQGGSPSTTSNGLGGATQNSQPSQGGDTNRESTSMGGTASLSANSSVGGSAGESTTGGASAVGGTSGAESTSTTPVCGNGRVEGTEICDDGNTEWGDTCFLCQKRFYFILNAPSTNSSGHNSIVRVTTQGDSSTILEPNILHDGIQRIAVEPNGSQLYALQSQFSNSIFRIKFVNLKTGTVSDLDLDDSNLGYAAKPNALCLGLNSKLYVELENSTLGVAHLVSIDTTTKAITEELSYSTQTVGARDMVQATSYNGNFYISGYKETYVASVAYDTWKLLLYSGTPVPTAPFGIAYDEQNAVIWLTEVTGSAAHIFRYPLRNSDNAGLYATITNDIQVRGIFIETDGTPIVPLGTLDKVVSVKSDGTLTDIWTSADGLDYPTDIKAVTLPD